MALTKKGKFWYGSTPEDTQAAIHTYSVRQGCEAVKFRASICTCGHQTFKLDTDENEGVAQRSCSRCGSRHFMGDSAAYAADAALDSHECVCDGVEFALVSGVALYPDSNDVRWYYIGCQCTQCQLTGVFADWKCEAGDADALLAKV